MAKLLCEHVLPGGIPVNRVHTPDGVICYFCHDTQERARYAPKVVERVTVPLRPTGMCTMVGIIPGPDYDGTGPLLSGNCCGLGNPSYPCANMSMEDIEQAAKNFPDLEEGVEVEVFEWETRKACRVVDSRLPEIWRSGERACCGYYERSYRERKDGSGEPPP